MSTRLSIALAVALGLAVGISSALGVSAQRPSTNPPSVQRTNPALGETEVGYYDNGSLEYTKRIPSDSMFNTSGAGSGGGAVQECETYFWFTTEPNPNAVTNPENGELIDLFTGLPTTPDRGVEIRQPSTAWFFEEMEPSGTWSPQTQGAADAIGSFGGLGGVTLTSSVSAGETYFATTSPLAAATRRFRVYCGVPENYGGDAGTWGPNGTFEGYRTVPMTDPFWNPLERLGILWGMIQLPSYRVIAPPEVNTYGGLVVNMPTWLQIEANAWRPYFTEVDEYMGWTSQLGLFPSGLRFEVVGTGGGTIPCAPAESAARGGAIPRAPEDLPRYYELGQLDQDCTWVPQEPGQVTVRARITYDVLLTISGYSEWLSPYVWYSDPLTMSVGELRIRNVTPPGGIGG